MAQRDPAARQRIRELVGDVRPLPLRVAGEVAWKSIKVRLSRSLVTVSSVVLAVAFLLVVLGAELTNRAVHATWLDDQQPIADVASAYELLSRPRTPAVLLRTLADPVRSERLTSWAAGLTDQPVTVDRAQAAFWNDLATWVDNLSATDEFKIVGNRPVVRWLLDLDGTVAKSDQAELDRFLELVATFRGVRLEADPAEIRQRLPELAALRASLDALRAAERRRLELVAQAEGPAAVMAALERGALTIEALPGVGLPIRQIIPDIDAERLARMRSQLAIDAERAVARDILTGFNKRYSSARPLELIQVFNGEAADDVRLPLLRQRLEQEHGAQAIAALGEALLAGTTIPQQSPVAATRRAAKETLKDFNKSFSGRKPIRLVQIADASLGSDARRPLLEEQLDRQLGAESLARVRAELRHRQTLGDLRDSLIKAGFDPEDEGEKTFWLLVLSLLVCIVGIVNSMMMAVTERFREIATMKCLGAMDQFILKAFLLESGSVGVVGSVLGAVLGVVVVLFQSSSRYGGTFWASLPLGDFALAALAALVCGVILTIFGALLPAYKAARMHPIEAMRLET